MRTEAGKKPDWCIHKRKNRGRSKIIEETLSCCNLPETEKRDRILIIGAGGFISGSLTCFFDEQSFTRLRTVDEKTSSPDARKCWGARKL